MSEKQQPLKKRKSFLKKSFSRLVAATINRISFVDIAEKIANSEPGTPFLDRYKKLPEDWQNTEEINRIAVDLTMEQLKNEGEAVPRSEIEALIDEIAIRYNRKLHEDTASSLGVAFDQVFDHQNPDLPFTSPDKRELQHIEKLREYREKGLGVVYLINHSSHLDEFLVDLMWQNLGLGLPVFAAGQNMMVIKSIEKVLMTGSYVVLRQGASRHQVAALCNYCSALSRAGAQQGIFLEAWRGGARTRDGSLRYPKRLVTLKGAINVEEDVVIQPVALSYSAVPEDLMMCSRKSGMSWLRGMGLFKTLANIPLHPKTFLWRSAENLYGRAYVTVPPPMLLSELKEAHAKDKTGISLDEFVALSSIKEIARNKKIMASQVTARGLVLAKKQGSGDLGAAVASEIQAIKEYHVETFGEAPEFEDYITNNTVEAVVTDGLKTLKRRGVLKLFGKDYSGLPAVKDEIALSYYATHGDRRLYSPTADLNIVVVGAGNWGFAIASLIGNRMLDNKKYNNASITIFDARKDVAKHMGRNRQGPGRFKDKMLPKNIFVTCDHPSAFRKASEVIVASKPETFEQDIRNILKISEQPLKLTVATRGFIPGMNCIPFTAVRRLISEYHRDDVEILTLAGPVSPGDVADPKEINGILAGPRDVIRQISDMFDPHPKRPLLSDDPLGVQAADILSRVYAIWVNFMTASKRITQAPETGYLMAAISKEVSDLSMALGANKETFTAGSIAWNATFVAVCLEGIWHDFGKKAGLAVKKGKDPKSVVEKLNRQWTEEGNKLQSLTDIKEALACAEKLGIDMPVLREMEETFWGTAEETNQS
ncbi:MAG: 1-acyl-sn-glycerol-3-phosphate acyltransferase [Desulfobacterium sp.]|nr:1-acyl-sn-glycerol-3-phosphate acyltransferase [Desulfobacterium sp.]